MGECITHWLSCVLLLCSALLTCASDPCPKPDLSENTRVVPLHTDVNLTCPGCSGEVMWVRQNQTLNLQEGPHLSLRSVSYEDEDNYTCYKEGAPSCTVQLLVEDDLEKPTISCYIRHPTHNISCDWQTTRKLRPHAEVTLIAWMLKRAPIVNSCNYATTTGKFTCSTLYKEGDSGRHTMSLCVIGRTDRQMSNTMDSTMEYLVQPAPPINVTVTSVENQPRKLWVSWSPPGPWLNDFYKLEYQVQYRVKGSQLVSNGTTDEKHFAINDALARRQHTIRVRAKDEFYYTWSAWSEEAVASPWSAEEDKEGPLTTVFSDFIVTSSEEEDEDNNVEMPPALVPRYVWLVAGVSFIMVLILFLGLLMRNKEMKLLKLKGGLLRALFQPSRSTIAMPQPPSREPLLMTPCPPPEGVTVTAPRTQNED